MPRFPAEDDLFTEELPGPADDDELDTPPAPDAQDTGAAALRSRPRR